jgi:hypothetical protein
MVSTGSLASRQSTGRCFTPGNVNVTSRLPGACYRPRADAGSSSPADRSFSPRSLSGLGLICCAGGRAAHSSPISRYIAPLCASKSENSVLALPPCSRRSPKSDRLLVAHDAIGAVTSHDALPADSASRTGQWQPSNDTAIFRVVASFCMIEVRQAGRPINPGWMTHQARPRHG